MRRRFPSNAKYVWAGVACALLVAVAATPGSGRAQAGVPVQLVGTWAHDGEVARGMHTVERAFAAPIAALPSFFQGMARDRIRESLEPPRTVEVALTGGRIRVTLRGREIKTIDGPLDAHATTSGVAEGTTVTPRVASGWLELLYEGESSEMHQLFSTEPDGTHLHLDYTVVNERLGGNVRYRLEYVRAP